MRRALSQSRFLLFGALALFMIMGITLSSCEQVKDIADKAGGRSEKSDIMKEVKRLYRMARESGEQVPEDVADWVKQDIEKIGDWEYKIVRLPFRDTASLEGRLNELGRDRWEVFWVRPDGNNTVFFLKRRVRSYIRSIPMSSLIKVFPQGQSGPSVQAE